MNRALHGSCHVPVAAHATLTGAGLHLVGLVGDVASGAVIRAEADAAADQADALGQRVAAALFAQGAGALLQAYVAV
jgi:hydroxymethylbilane synthase